MNKKENKKTLVPKDNFIFALIRDIEEMMYKEPKCDFEHHWNITLEKVIENIKTFYDENPKENVIIEDKPTNSLS